MADQRSGGISWCDQTWGPTRGCSRVSAGCANCYAERIAGRFSGSGKPFAGFAILDDRGARWTGKVELVEKHLLDPLRWKRPRRVFVNSMSDLFHESLDGPTIARVFAVMALATWHTFQVLTKRAAKMREVVSDVAFRREVERVAYEMDNERGSCFLRAGNWPLPNVWLGVSAEDQAAADERVPHLLATPAAIRFLSAEPLLGPISLRAAAGGVDWVIVGGESGPNARPMRTTWATDILDQCGSSGAAPWFKQTGSVLARELGLKDRAGSDPDEFPDWARDQQRFPVPAAK